MNRLSAVIITKNAAKTLSATLQSVAETADEVLVVDGGSTDTTVAIARSSGARVLAHIEPDFGKQKQYAVKNAQHDWVLVIDSDEVLPPDLAREVKKILTKPEFNAYFVPFQTFLFGRPLSYGGETYKKLILFNRRYVRICASLIHEKFETDTPTGTTAAKMNHYSYRSLGQLFRKFTDYALRDIEQKKRNREQSGLKKIILYPVHMFWSRYIKDEGFRDGPMRIILDLGFAYMEFLTYFALYFSKHEKNN